MKNIICKFGRVNEDYLFYYRAFITSKLLKLAFFPSTINYYFTPTNYTRKVKKKYKSHSAYWSNTVIDQTVSGQFNLTSSKKSNRQAYVSMWFNCEELNAIDVIIHLDDVCTPYMRIIHVHRHTSHQRMHTCVHNDISFRCKFRMRAIRTPTMLKETNNEQFLDRMHAGWWLTTEKMRFDADLSTH